MSNIKLQRRARELAFYVIFSSLSAGRNVDESLKGILESDESEGMRGEITEKVNAWRNNADTIDQIIEGHLTRGRLQDIAAVALSALRLGIAEMEYVDEIPPQVAINEAVELAKTYGDPDLARFVNGIMDARLRAVNSKGDKDE